MRLERWVHAGGKVLAFLYHLGAIEARSITEKDRIVNYFLYHLGAIEAY